MLVVDIETTWLDTEKCSILSIWALCLEQINNTFYWECKIWDWADIYEEWLAINWFTKENIKDSKKQNEWELIFKFLKWLDQFDNKIIAWQHPMALDIPILKSACKRANIDYKFSHKTIDLHSLAYWYFLNKWIQIPLKEDWTSDISLDYIAKYFDLWEEPKPHNALNGAKYEAECFGQIIYNKKLWII